jgi:GT2 family glycosyltransferase
VADRDDIVDATVSLYDGLSVVFGPRGSAGQRNRGIGLLRPDIEIVLFMDDDTELRDDYVETMHRAFTTIPDLVLMSGRELANGADRDYARLLLVSDAHAYHPAEWQMSSGDIYEDVWGTNMAVRRNVLDRVIFDERLPLYAWLEDFDFALQCAAYGRIARIENCRIVHLNTQLGRVSQVRLGFAQTINPVYIWRKGYPEFPAHKMLELVGRTVLANFLKLPLDPANRLHRLKGSLIALAMIARGDLRPERMVELP